MSELKVTAENLNATMSFGRIIRVNADGTVTDVEDDYYFEVGQELQVSGIWESREELPEGWSLMTGYTGQWSYNGPHMHASEFIGGRMAQDILSTPGLYVALEVTPNCGYTEDGCTEDDGCYCDPDSWVVAMKQD